MSAPADETAPLGHTEGLEIERPARRRASRVGELRTVIAVALTLGYLYAVYKLVNGAKIDEASKDVLLVLLGALSGRVGTIVDFLFGSADKREPA